MKNCQPRRVSRTLTSSTEEKNLVNPNMGQTQFLQKFDMLGFSRLQEHLTISSTVQSLVACFSKLGRWHKHKHKQYSEPFLQKEAEFLCNIDCNCLTFSFLTYGRVSMIQVRRKKRTGAKGLSFCHSSSLRCRDQMLAVIELSHQHIVSSSKTVRPIISRGARCVSHIEIMWSAVCSLAPHPQFSEEA